MKGVQICRLVDHDGDRYISIQQTPFVGYEGLKNLSSLMRDELVYLSSHLTHAIIRGSEWFWGKSEVSDL